MSDDQEEEKDEAVKRNKMLKKRFFSQSDANRVRESAATHQTENVEDRD